MFAISQDEQHFIMRTNIFIIISFMLFTQNCRGQNDRNIVILTVKDDRVELMKALSFLRFANPKHVCLNVNLSECNQDSIDSELGNVLNGFDSLITASELVPFGTGKYRDVRLLCSYFYSDGQKDGFVNLIFNDITNQIEKFKPRNIYKTTSFQTGEISERIRYHMAVDIAFAINPEKTNKFISLNKDTIKIDFHRKRQFENYSFDEFVKDKIDNKILEGKVVVITTNLPSDYLLVPNYDSKIEKSSKMLTSEIFANIAFQIIGE